MSVLAVWMYGKRVGVLRRVRGELALEYTEEALELGLGRPLLSVSMPTRTRRYSGSAPHAFFDGLLPEGESRRMIAHDFGVAERDVLGLLRAIGRDCAGALTILPADALPADEGVPEPIGDAQVAERIRRLRVAPLGVDQRVRVSLAGMQHKLLLARLGDGWGLPIDRAPSTHIVKPPHALLPDAVANEALCMRIAQLLGVPAARAEVGDFDGLPVLIVERYDRSPADEAGRVFRLHQEDFCQAHAVDSFRKYEEAGGPSLRECAQLLERWTAEPGQLERLLELTAVNVLIGNGDAHAKNLSLLLGENGRVQLAPAYDLLSTIRYPNVSTTAGMYVNGIREITAITRADLIAEAVSWGLPRGTAAATVEHVLAHGAAAVTRAAGELEPPEALVEQLLARAQALAA